MQSPSDVPTPSSKPQCDRAWWRWLIFGIIAALLLIGSFHFDDFVIRLVNDHPNARLRAFGRFVSHYGDWPEHVVLGGILWAIAYVLHSRRWQRIALMMLAACALAGLSSDAVRFATGRPRPSTHIVDGWYGPHTDYNHSSFPSGHTSASAGFFLVLAFVEWPVGALAMVFPILVGLARILVGAHHFSDIIASFIIGIFCAYLVQRYFSMRAIRLRAR